MGKIERNILPSGMIDGVRLDHQADEYKQLGFDADSATDITGQRFSRASDSAAFEGSDGNLATAVDDALAVAYRDGLKLGVPLFGVIDNLLTYSEQFDNAAWSLKSNTTVTPNTTTAPDGTTTADTVTAGAATTATYVGRYDLAVLTGANTFSIFAKAGTHEFIQLINTGDAAAFANFDLDGGVVGTSGSKTTAAITDVGGGWYRCEARFDATVAYAIGYRCYIAPSASAGYAATFAGDGTQTVIIWGAQLETGSVATPYIPTEASAVATAADNYRNIDPAAAGLPTDALYVTGRVDLGALQQSSFQFLFEASDGTQHNRRTVFWDGANSRFTLADDFSTVLSARVVHNTTEPGYGEVWFAARFEPDGSAGLSINGGDEVTLAADAWVQDFNQIRPGGSFNNVFQLNGILSDLTAYRNKADWDAAKATHKPIWLAETLERNAVLNLDFTHANSVVVPSLDVSPYQLNRQSRGALDAWLANGRASAKTVIRDGVLVTLADNENAIGDGGLDIHAGATNLHLNSEDATTASKFGTGAGGLPTVTANAGTAPDGTATADRVQWDATGGLAGLTFSAPDGSALDINSSVWVRSRAGTVAVLFRAHSLDSNQLMTITGDWQRISDSAIATTKRNPQLYSGSGGTDAVVDLEVWGVQVTEGSTNLVPYIPTAGSTAATAADEISIPLTAIPGFDPTQPFSVRVEWEALSPAATQRVFSINDGSFDNEFSLFSNAGDITGRARAAAATTLQNNQGTWVKDAVFKVAIRFEANNFAMSVNGASPVVDTSGALASGVDILELGQAIAANQLGGKLLEIGIDQPPLSNADLQAWSGS